MTSSRASLQAAASASADATNEETVVLAAGNHGFQFDYTLPRDLPSSYQGRWGQVKFTVKATLKRPCRFDIERETEMNVIAYLDLNDDPELAVSIRGVIETNLQGGPKHLAHFFVLLVTSSVLNNFQTFFTVRIGRKSVIVVKLSLKIPRHLKCVATLLCEIFNVLMQQLKTRLL